VTTIKGPVLVVAGAGTGKTRTLVYRLAHMVNQGIRPKNVLLLTFTRRAAEEMLRRAEALVSDSAGRAEGGTFHSIAAMILRKYAQLIDYPSNFTILDTADSIELIGRCRTAQNLDFKSKRFPRKATIQNLISKSINKNTPIEFIVYDDYPQYIDFIDVLEAIRQEYNSIKKDRGMMDFDDLLINMVKLLKENEEIRLRLRNRYKYLMVDEYQDTNPLQAEIIELLAGENGNVMVVGDDSQSIYAFRGANYRNILEFPKKFKNCKVIKLEKNYRSSQKILNVANRSIENAIDKYTKVLEAIRGDGKQVVVVAAEDESFRAGL
jgi:DNA helicase-2/ATP-dependent DNA helicase PcrA